MEYFQRPGTAHFYMTMSTLDARPEAIVSDIRVVALNGPEAGKSQGVSLPVAGQMVNGRTLHEAVLEDFVTGGTSKRRFTGTGQNTRHNPIEAIKEIESLIYKATGASDRTYIWLQDAITVASILASFMDMPYNSNCVGPIYRHVIDPAALLQSVDSKHATPYLKEMARIGRDFNEFTRATAILLADVLDINQYDEAKERFVNNISEW